MCINSTATVLTYLLNLNNLIQLQRRYSVSKCTVGLLYYNVGLCRVPVESKHNRLSKSITVELHILQRLNPADYLLTFPLVPPSGQNFYLDTKKIKF